MAGSSKYSQGLSSMRAVTALSGWSSPVEVKPVGKSALEELLRGQVEIEVSGLGNNNALLFKVPQGWKWKDFE